MAGGDAAPDHVLGVAAAGDSVGVLLEVADGAGRVEPGDDLALAVEQLGVLVLQRAAQGRAAAGVVGDRIVGGRGDGLKRGGVAAELGVLAGLAHLVPALDGGFQGLGVHLVVHVGVGVRHVGDELLERVALLYPAQLELPRVVLAPAAVGAALGGQPLAVHRHGAGVGKGAEAAGDAVGVEDGPCGDAGEVADRVFEKDVGMPAVVGVEPAGLAHEALAGAVDIYVAVALGRAGDAVLVVVVREIGRGGADELAHVSHYAADLERHAVPVSLVEGPAVEPTAGVYLEVLAVHLLIELEATG